jgi:ABC-type oligopeptide transport system substrate-binding subunit
LHRKKRLQALVALLLGLSLFAAACGDDDETGSEGGDGETTETTAAEDGGEASDGGEAAAGGELIDLGTFVGDPPEHIDPALNSTLDAYQVINALYDGLTDIDVSDPANPAIVPDVASEITPNEDASEWVFTIRDDEFFSNGEQVLPSSFERAWNRAAAMGGDYSYLVTFIEGGAEALEGTAETISGVVADDEAMTLTVTLSAPYANFDAVAGFQLFFPMPSAVDELEDQGDWENGVMIGNGPFMMEAARTDEEIVLVPNPEWNGDIYGNAAPILDRITFRTVADPDTGYNAFEAGEGDTANIPPGRVAEARENWGTTLDVDILGSYHWVVNSESEIVGGEENLLLRQAINQAINREEINEAVYNGSRNPSTGVTPPGIPGFMEGLCSVCEYDPEAAQAAFDEWVAAGNELTEPIPLQFNADAGHEPVAQIVIDNLAQIGIEAVAEPMDGETYFSDMADGACKAICRAGWFADYPTYDNFMYDLFHGDSIGGNNLGPYVNAEFDALITEAKQTIDKDAAAALYQQAETILLDEVGVIPMNWYRGDYAYNDEKIAVFPQTNFGLILWEQVALKG